MGRRSEPIADCFASGCVHYADMVARPSYPRMRQQQPRPIAAVAIAVDAIGSSLVFCP